MLKELATVAAYGASASFGRDVYKSSKKENPILWLAVAMALSIMGFYQLAKGHDRGLIGTILLTFIGSIMMIGVGCFFFLAAFMFIASYTDIIRYLFFRYQLTLFQLGTLFLIGYGLLSALIGIPWGLSERKARAQKLEIETHNENFLVDEGFHDSGVGDDIIEDREGNRLKLREQDEERLVFTIVGRRNIRAVITTDEYGRMMEYTGPIRL